MRTCDERTSNENAPERRVWELVADSSRERQLTEQGEFLFWWTRDDGTREGMLCELVLCPVPICPLHDGTLHAVRVGPDFVRVWVDERDGWHVDGRHGPIDLEGEPRQAAIKVQFEDERHCAGPAVGDRELVRRLYEVLDDEVFAAMERYWVGCRGQRLREQRVEEPGRNDPCPCGSGKKYKKCCLGKGIRLQRLPAGATMITVPLPPGLGGNGVRLH